MSAPQMVLLLNMDVVAEVRRVMAYAEAHPLSRRALVSPPPGDFAPHRVEIPVGFRCVYTVEDQPAGICRHLSVAVAGKGRWVGRDHLSVIMQVFGFTREFARFLTLEPGSLPVLEGTWLYTEPEVEAVDVVERLDRVGADA